MVDGEEQFVYGANTISLNTLVSITDVAQNLLENVERIPGRTLWEDNGAQRATFPFLSDKCLQNIFIICRGIDLTDSICPGEIQFFIIMFSIFL